jgi:hypothetical protein
MRDPLKYQGRDRPMTVDEVIELDRRLADAGRARQAQADHPAIVGPVFHGRRMFGSPEPAPMPPLDYPREHTDAEYEAAERADHGFIFAMMLGAMFWFGVTFAVIVCEWVIPALLHR